MLLSIVITVSLLGAISTSLVLNFRPEAKIIAGTEATKGQFPYVALVGYKETYEGKWKSCGGSIISDRYILTAAFCTYR